MATRYRRNPATVARVLDGQAHVVSPDHGSLHTLNHTATILWQLAARGCTVEEAALALTNRYDVELERARHDVEHCLANLVLRGLLVADEESSGR